MEDLVGVSGHGAISPEQRDSRTRSYFENGANISIGPYGSHWRPS